ncbi:MAG TPA: arsenosugar biosynthesis-associated peroxidase-like protein [Anaerolineae bacterium]|nr:arsenosugar biosynthesis-associated peroxidase-like protein [Anaerolineae bacterium]
MADPYYSEEDLAHLHEIGEDSPLGWQRFQSWCSQVMGDGALTRREKSLVALAVAHAIACPYSIDAYTEDCLEKGYNMAQTTEAVQVAAAVRGGSVLMHGLQMRNSAAKHKER